MRFAHISDLHLGKRINNFSMLEDQTYLLEQIVETAIREQVDGVLVAGDVYDKAIPPAEAVALFDDFLVRLSRHGLPAFVISGNHDSPERIAFGSRLFCTNGIYLSPVFDGKIEPVTMKDAYGEIDIYLLPFVKPIHVRHFYPQEKIESYTDAIACVIRHMNIRKDHRNVLVAHQFVTGAKRCDSEECSIGGLDNVDKDVLADFDYVALGHIHGPQNIGSERIRYCGSPMKYSFSECSHKKSITIVELEEKGKIFLRYVPLTSKHDFIKIKGTFEELMNEKFYQNIDCTAYMQVTLLDEMDVPNAFYKLAIVYPNLMQMEYDNSRTRANKEMKMTEDVKQMDPLQLFSDFYQSIHGQPLSGEQQDYLMEKLEKIGEADI